MFWLIFISVVASSYIGAGVGFTLASWLEAAGNAVKNKESVPSLFCFSSLLFTLVWPLFAVYCYRAEVSRTIPDHFYVKETLKDKNEKPRS